MQERVYIHYGHKKFDLNLFDQIKNATHWVKPYGGLWASPIDAVFGWKEWCEENCFRECEKSNSFTFSLPEANIYTIDSSDKLRRLPLIKEMPGHSSVYLCIAFDKCVDLGYDAIEVVISADHQLYWDLYGWDCDSILVMNPSKIRVLEPSAV